jgi:hypothetical protein
MLWFKRVRHSIAALFVMTIFINIGMWFERYVIIVTSLSTEFMPFAWGVYRPSVTEMGIVIGTFGWFFFWFLLFIRLLPPVAIAEIKEVLPPPMRPKSGSAGGGPMSTAAAQGSWRPTITWMPRWTPSRSSGEGFEEITAFAPFPEHHIEHALGYGASPVRLFTLVGGLTGMATGLAFTTFTSMDWPLVVGGKPILSIPAYVIPTFEMTILFGALFTVVGVFWNMRIPDIRNRWSTIRSSRPGGSACTSRPRRPDRGGPAILEANGPARCRTIRREGPMAERGVETVRSRSWFALVLVVLTGAGCTPMDDIMVAIFGRSMRDQPSIGAYENPRLPAQGTVPFASGNFPAAPGEFGMNRRGDRPAPSGGSHRGPPGHGEPRRFPHIGAREPGGRPTPRRWPGARSSTTGPACPATGSGRRRRAGGRPRGPPVRSSRTRRRPSPTDTSTPSSGSGEGAMPAYGHQISHFDRWHVVNYVRQLQGAPRPAGDPDRRTPRETPPMHDIHVPDGSRRAT